MGTAKPTPEVILSGMIDVVKRKYSYLAMKQDEFAMVKRSLESGLSKINNYSDLMHVAIESFAVLNDGHVRVVDGQGNSHSVCSQARERNFNQTVTDTYLSGVDKNGPLALGTIDDMLYVRLDSLSNHHRNSYDAFFSRDEPSQQKLIVDLRANSGGNSDLAKTLTRFAIGPEGHFISHYHRFRTDENNPFALTDFHPCYTFANGGSRRRNVIILIGSYTYSSAEMLTMNLAAIPGTMLIGDTTGGGSGCPQRYVVDGPHKGAHIPYLDKPNDYGAAFALDVPSWLGYRLDQALLQNRGIEPHVVLNPDESIVDNRDLVLEKAIELHSNGYVAK